MECELHTKTRVRSFLTNSVILLGLANAPQNLFSNYSHPFYELSKPGFSDTVTLSTHGVVNKS
jgi:hypothetical protein